MFSTRAFNSDNVIAIAMMDYQEGRFAEAERGCRTVLKLIPDDASALYLLGLTEVQAGNSADERRAALTGARMRMI
jgi:Flp pilus assembly protein TadD